MSKIKVIVKTVSLTYLDFRKSYPETVRKRQGSSGWPTQIRTAVSPKAKVYFLELGKTGLARLLHVSW